MPKKSVKRSSPKRMRVKDYMADIQIKLEKMAQKIVRNGFARNDDEAYDILIDAISVLR